MAIKDLTPWGKKRREEESRVPAPRDVEELFRETFEHPFRSWLMAPWRLAGRELYRFSPDVDVSETATDYRVTAELPGLTKDDVSVSLDEGVLTISGEKKEEKKEEEENYVKMERSYGSFVRRIPLPMGVKEDAVTATFRNGILTVTLPKTEEAKGRRIEIEGG